MSERQFLGEGEDMKNIEIGSSEYTLKQISEHITLVDTLLRDLEKKIAPYSTDIIPLCESEANVKNPEIFYKSKLAVILHGFDTRIMEIYSRIESMRSRVDSIE